MAVGPQAEMEDLSMRRTWLYQCQTVSCCVQTHHLSCRKCALNILHQGPLPANVLEVTTIHIHAGTLRFSKPTLVLWKKSHRFMQTNYYPTVTCRRKNPLRHFFLFLLLDLPKVSSWHHGQVPFCWSVNDFFLVLSSKTFILLTCHFCEVRTSSLVATTQKAVGGLGCGF